MNADYYVACNIVDSAGTQIGSRQVEVFYISPPENKREVDELGAQLTRSHRDYQYIGATESLVVTAWSLMKSYEE